MKLSTTLFLLTITPWAWAQETVNDSPEDKAAAALIKRVLPTKADSFIIDTALPQQDGKDVFSLSDATEGKILLQGNNGVSVASALNWYLKNISHNHVSWCGDQLNFPETLPKVGKKVTVTTVHKYRVYFNYCTLSYTAAWWDWKRWQREIDFMAMNGINTPLSVVGLEAVWYNTLLQYGFSDLEARTFLVDPAHMAWQWMTNIETHGGPLPKSWIDSHIKLGRQILNSQRALGMTPIQQGFSGCVPMAMIKKFPDSKILKEDSDSDHKF
jgi:alpha-N-acetylglucosaminidase